MIWAPVRRVFLIVGALTFAVEVAAMVCGYVALESVEALEVVSAA